MTDNQKHQDNRSRAWLLVGLVLFIAGACWWLMRTDSAAEATQANDASVRSPAADAPADVAPDSSESAEQLPADDDATDDGNVLFGVALSQRAAELLGEVSPLHGGLAVTDDAGNIYFTKQFEDKDGVFRRDPSGEEVLIWKTKRDEQTHIEIAGRQGEHLLINDAAGPPLTEAAQAWRAASPTYGLSTRAFGVGVWPDHGHKELKEHFRAAE